MKEYKITICPICKNEITCYGLLHCAKCGEKEGETILGKEIIVVPKFKEGF